MAVDYNRKQMRYAQFYNAYVPAYVPAGKKVLDVGCSAGQLGKVLKEDKGCTVYGVDISLDAVRSAAGVLHAAAVMDVEQDPFPFAGHRFQVILFVDVLEHLFNAEAVLKKFQHYLTPDGVMVVSIPNVANVSIRLRLLMGRWDYTASGILDEGHVRFYTLKTMRALFHACGLQIKEQGFAPRYRCKRLTRLRPTLLANQFIFVLQPRVRTQD
ncbi:MAG TPA: class I SAM-dependent methyltransferase [bacterium]|nr:class I SAM-dependent methyltransferase [bacterium]HPN34621.1 class I SAM-dependent methyltransferase [bacterium]